MNQPKLVGTHEKPLGNWLPGIKKPSIEAHLFPPLASQVLKRNSLNSLHLKVSTTAFILRSKMDGLGADVKELTSRMVEDPSKRIQISAETRVDQTLSFEVLFTSGIFHFN